jgi:glycogen phosphorylase
MLRDKRVFRRRLVERLASAAAKTPESATRRDWYLALAMTLRDQLAAGWIETKQRHYSKDVKRVYYLSLEFLIGRSLLNALNNLGLMESCVAALNDLGLSLDEIAEAEDEAGLGNGGLGRLAACYLDSMATLDIAGRGYGIRYEYGIFRQQFEEGQQVERPDNWLRYGNHWEFPRPEILYPIRFGGVVETVEDAHGQTRHRWTDTNDVMAMAYDVPIPGFGGRAVSSVRLWSAKASREIDLTYFNSGNYLKAVQEKNESEEISKVLYPDDSTAQGRELRFKQQYFFVSASLQDILVRFKVRHKDLRRLPRMVAIQLNDSHPAVSVAELMRILIDDERLAWEDAWRICCGVFAYTNHTLLPEALEKWPVALFADCLPRHLEIIYAINDMFLADVRKRFPGDEALVRRVSLIEEQNGQSVRMAHLAVLASRVVNGVSAMHTELLRTTIFRDFVRLFPRRIANVTNGVTPRRWLWQANPPLRRVISARIGEGWVTDLDQLRRLEPLAEDRDFVAQVTAAKVDNKVALASFVRRCTGEILDPDSLFDVQVKRIHEYKRQMLNILHAMSLYGRLLKGEDIGVSRTLIFAGKAAPGYVMAKLTIRLILTVARVLSRDPNSKDRLRVVFLPNYDVSMAERVFPATDLSEQISTAGFEASGTGNMKSVLNAALMIATADGANLELVEAGGPDSNFLFGAQAREVQRRRHEVVDFQAFINDQSDLSLGLDTIRDGFNAVEREAFLPLLGPLIKGDDPYFVLRDFVAYEQAQREVAEVFATPSEWGARVVHNLAGCGRFSSDRAVSEYARKIWRL